MAYTTTPADNETIANLPGDIRAVTTLVTNHTEATSAAHAASAISYGTNTVETALDTAAGHEANQNNPHGVTAAQAGAVALTAVATAVTPNAIVQRDSNGFMAGNITGNAATATTATTATTAGSISNGGNNFIPSWDGTEVKFQVNSTADVPVHNAMLLQGMTPTQVVANNNTYFTGSTQGALNITYLNSTGNTTPGSLNTITGIGAGTYQLSNILQQLINMSHSHTASVPANCNCNCSCNG